MRRYHIVSKIIFILPIIDFIVAAPVPVQEKPQALDALAGDYVVHIPEDAITILEKRVDESEWEKVISNFLGNRPGLSSRPSGSSATPPLVLSFSAPRPNIARPPGESSAAPPSVPLVSPFSTPHPIAHPSVNDPAAHFDRRPGNSPASASSVSSVNPFSAPRLHFTMPMINHFGEPPDFPRPPGLIKLFGAPAPSSVKPFRATRPSWWVAPGQPLPSWRPNRWIDPKQPLPSSSIPKEPPPVSSPDHSPPTSHDGMNELMFKLSGNTENHGGAEPGESSAARPSSSSRLARPTNWWINPNHPVPFIHKEPSPMSSSDHSPMFNLVGDTENHGVAEPGGSSAARPSLSPQLSRPTNWLTHLKQPLPSIPEEPSPVSSSDHSPPGSHDTMNEPMIKLFGDTESHGVAEPGESSAAHPASSSLPSEPTDERIGINQPLPSIPHEPSPVFSPDHSPPSSHNRMNELMFKLFGDTESHGGAEPDLNQPLPSVPEKAPTEWPLDVPSLKEHGSDQKLTEAPATALPPNPNKRPWTGPNPEGPDDSDWRYWTKIVNQRLKRPALAKESDLAPIPESEHQVVHADSGSNSETALLADSENDWMYSKDSSPIPERVSQITDPSQLHKPLVAYLPHAEFPPVEQSAPSADPNFDWEYWMNVEDPPPLKLESPRPLSSRPSEAEPTNPGPSKPGSPNPGPANPRLSGLSNTEPSNSDPSNPSLQTEPENPSDQQPLSEEEQRQAALYAAKGKGKQFRRIFVTTRDVGNVAQRVF